MNIKIANKLVELRKKNGLSQEELADKLGLSRQAVSKWERAESSPDTDNLICLAKLYNVSLDELLNTDETVEEISREVKEKEMEKNAEKKLFHGDRYDHLSEKEKKRAKKFDVIEGIVTSTMFLIVTIIYFWVSSIYPEQWGKLWILYLVPTWLPSILHCIKNRRITQFVYPTLATTIFLFVGMYFDVWHPTWLVFLTIPVFYSAFGPIDKAIAEKRGEPLDPEDNDKDDEDDDEE